jgi:hypothetical protein
LFCIKMNDIFGIKSGSKLVVQGGQLY